MFLVPGYPPYDSIQWGGVLPRKGQPAVGWPKPKQKKKREKKEKERRRKLRGRREIRGIS